jgi:hypothetical protein
VGTGRADDAIMNYRSTRYAGAVMPGRGCMSESRKRGSASWLRMEMRIGMERQRGPALQRRRRVEEMSRTRDKDMAGRSMRRGTALSKRRQQLSSRGPSARRHVERLVGSLKIRTQAIPTE